MYVTTAVVTNQHINEIARIGFEAFREVAQVHGVEPDFPTLDLARQVYRMLVNRTDYYGVVAIVGGKVVGSNFISTTDSISGIGPLAVDPAFQGQGIGRALMLDVLRYTQMHDIAQVRLLRDSHNMASLSLYTSLGFEVRDAVALVTVPPSRQLDSSIRSIRQVDLDKLDLLAKKLTGASRQNEIKQTMSYGFPALLRERDHAISGYLVPGLAGHGVSETEEDALALLQHSAKSIPSVFAKVFCPLRHSGLFRSLLKHGGRVEKTLTYMSLGPYQYPAGVCTPSAGY